MITIEYDTTDIASMKNTLNILQNLFEKALKLENSTEYKNNNNTNIIQSEINKTSNCRKRKQDDI